MLHDDEGSSSSEDDAPVESLIHGREKRSTAGSRLSALLDAEADDDLALLFEEVDDDNEFSVDAGEEGGEEEDMGLDSSSDDEDDQGPNAQADDLEGEKQLEKEEKAEKKKRRAREDLRYRIASKKVKIDPTVVSTTPAPAPRPRKKSERVSWIPTPEEGPTRSSSRRQTMQNKELTHARLKDSEEKRIRLIATMEEAAKRKAKLKPKKMTQAEHLAEAERVERLNSKSLNRWEEMEKRKAEERKAKIEALQNRRLEGPVVSYWSGIAKWVDGRLMRVGKVDITPKPEKEDTTRKKSKKGEKEGKNVTEQNSSEAVVESSSSKIISPATSSETAAGPETSTTTEPKQDQAPPQTQQTDVNANRASEVIPSNTAETITTVSEKPTESPKTVAEVQSLAPAPNALSNTEEVASSAPATTENVTPEEHSNSQSAVEESKAKTPPVTAGEEVAEDKASNEPQKVSKNVPQISNETLATKDDKQPAKDELSKEEDNPSDAVQDPASKPSPAPQLVSDTVTAASPAPVAPVATGELMQLDEQENPQNTVQSDQKNPEIREGQPSLANEDSDQPTVPAAPPVVEQTGRCLTVLENFDDKTAQSREFSIYFNAKKPPRLTKISSSLCVITSLPSRYRDPDTSLPFANSYAYHEIRHTAAQKYAWSPMLGCYVGPTGVAARGVPERFLSASQAKEKDNDQKTGDSEEKPAAAENEKDAVGKTTDNSASTPTPTMAPAAAATTTTPTPAAPTPTATGAGDAMEIDK